MIALKVTATFAVVSVLWIVFSDQLLGAFVHDPKVLTDLSSVKGAVYVLVVSTILFFQIRRYIARMKDAHQDVVRHEQELLLFEFTVDHATDMVVWVEPGNNIFYANQSAVRKLGYPLEVLKTLSVLDLQDPPDSPNPVAIWAQLRRTGSVQFTHRLRTASGTTLPVEVRVDLIEFQGKAFACASIRDLTDRLQVEEQLRQAQKLESVGTLAAGVAHDFNNILTVIQGCSELLALTPDDPVRSRPLIAKIQTAVRRASELVKGLLAFSRKESLQLQKFSFNEFVQKAADFLGRILGEGIRMELQLCEAETTVEADLGQWEQVILNLAINARDAMAGSGTLTLATEVGDGKVVLSVRDTGPGIPPAIVERIFEPFFTTKEAGKGTGLGLSIVYGIVNQHRGTIRVDSPPPGVSSPGTEFTITLALAST